MISNDQLIKDFQRTTEQFFSLEEFKALLESNRQLRIKYGVDVTAPYLHTGHAVNLWMMRKLQDMGHKVIFLIGDFTTRIGDPTGKNKTRPVIPQEEIEINTEKFIEQAKMVLRFDDPNLLEIRRNSEWFDSMPTKEFLELLSMVTHARLISRDMFQKRIEFNEEIYMHEMIYPILQGFDSFALNSDLTIIGSDQLFNEMLGRFYQEKFGQKPQVIITTKITPGIDGKAKQSKSLNNYIGLGHSARDKYGLVMSIPDNLILDYMKVYTEISDEEIQEAEKNIQSNPLYYKKRLAMEIVKRYHGTDVAIAELEWFEKTFSKKETPDEIPEIIISSNKITAKDLLIVIFKEEKSASEIKRLVNQGAVRIESMKINDLFEEIAINNGDIVKIGKRQWFKILIK